MSTVNAGERCGLPTFGQMDAAMAAPCKFCGKVADGCAKYAVTATISLSGQPTVTDCGCRARFRRGERGECDGCDDDE